VFCGVVCVCNVCVVWCVCVVCVMCVCVCGALFGMRCTVQL